MNDRMIYGGIVRSLKKVQSTARRGAVQTEMYGKNTSRLQQLQQNKRREAAGFVKESNYREANYPWMMECAWT